MNFINTSGIVSVSIILIQLLQFLEYHVNDLNLKQMLQRYFSDLIITFVSLNEEIDKVPWNCLSLI